MSRSDLTGQRLVAAFLFGWLLFNDPLLALFGRGAALSGIPLVWLYLFAAWALLIGLMAFLVERQPAAGDDSGAPPTLRE